ncbi:MAG: porin family protein [Coprobacter sp.]|nr:porin family protein [Coprobacter sp.]
MKRVKNSYMATVLLALFGLVLSPQVQGQNGRNGFFHIDWQFNVPLGNDFAGVASGWGMNFEGGYYLTPNWGVGLFLDYHTNNEYVSTRTITLNDHSAVTMDQQHSVFQLPFGASLRYRFLPDSFIEPYAAVKMGAEYARTATYYNVYETRDKSWGFTVSPEVGMSLYPTSNHMFGFHLALYYSYATNRSKVLVYKVDGLNNFGFRLGLSF